MKNFLVITNKDKDIDFIITNIVKNYLQQQKAKVTICSDLIESQEKKEQLLDNIDCVIVLGGDGTILRTAQVLLGKNIPIVGVNLGTLGFLAEIEIQNIEKTLEALLKGEYTIENRMMLESIIKHKGKMINKSFSLNDIAICRSGYSRIIQLEILVNGELLDIYEADGVIISTPTGSTGYNLSAGGPVVSPNTNLIIVTPISPHSLTARSIVLSDKDKLEVRVGRVRKTQLEEALATSDGQMGIILEPEDIVEIKKSEYCTKLVKINRISFYEILRNKISK